MGGEGSGPASARTVLLGLLADPDLPAEIAGRLAGELPRLRLYNAATVLTLALGVVSLYVALLVVTLAAAWLLVVAELLRQHLGHPVGWSDYLTVAWMASSIATVGGALGSGLESDAAVRAAAYGYRQQERQARRDP
jgi:hypothetical protein